MPLGAAGKDGFYDAETREWVIPAVPEHKGRGHSAIDDAKMMDYIKAGRSQAWIARHFKVSPAAVCTRIQRLKQQIVRDTASVAPQIIAREIRTADQLCKINNTANALLDSLFMTVDVEDPLTGEKTPQVTLRDPNLALRTMQEIRAQLKFQLEIFQTLTDAKAVKEFQDTVLETINSVDPGLREMVVKALQRKNALRSALEFK